MVRKRCDTRMDVKVFLMKFYDGLSDNFLINEIERNDFKLPAIFPG